MLRAPQRLSLVSQTTVALREHLVSGEAGTTLPGERELCERLGVSRMTLRAALAKLEAEGWIQGGQGRRRVVCPGGRRHSHFGNRQVAILSPLPLHAVDPRVLFWIDELR